MFKPSLVRRYFSTVASKKLADVLIVLGGNSTQLLEYIYQIPKDLELVKELNVKILLRNSASVIYLLANYLETR